MKRKLFSIFIAVVLVLSFSLVAATPVGAVAIYTEGHDFSTGSTSGTAAWSTAQVSAGSYSVELYVPDGVTDLGRVNLYLPTPVALSALSGDPTFLAYGVVEGDPWNSGPYLNILLDTNSDGTYDDALEGLVATSSDGYAAGWHEMAGGGYYDADDSLETNSYDDETSPTNLAYWQTVAPDDIVVGFQIMLGSCSHTTNGQTVYVDDVVIGATTYPMEPRVINTTTATGYNTIQAAIDAATTSNTITVAAGTYAEDLVIPDTLTGLALAGATGATIKGVDMVLSTSFPLADPNIDILADGVSIHGFTIQGPDPVLGYYSSGMLIGGAGVEIYSNAFEVGNSPNADDIGQAIQTYNKGAVPGVDVSGLSIHDNTFTHHGTGTIGFEAIYINRDEGTGTVTIADNDFTGNVVRGITTERSNTTISGNSLVTGAGLLLSGILVMDVGGFYDSGCEAQDNIAITGNTITGFDNGIKVGPSDQSQTLTNVSITNNTIQGNTTGVLVRSSAGGVVVNYNNINGNTTNGMENTDTGATLDAENNWWDSANGPVHADNTFNVGSQGNTIVGTVDFCPWLDAAYATGASFAPVNNTTASTKFSSIQAAVDAASASDVITVAAGTYTENVDVDRSLTLQGAGSAAVTVQAAVPGDHVFDVTASFAYITGFTVSGALGSGFAGIYLNANMANCYILYNVITNNDNGIMITGSAVDVSTWAVNYNNINSNANYGIVGAPGTGDLNARYNYWGSATGADPFTEANNPHEADAAGDPVNDGVDFIPWYATATTNTGAQGVSVDHPSSSIIAYSDTIQGGIDAAVVGDTVNVAAGTYTENVEVDKALTLAGASGATVNAAVPGDHVFEVSTDSVDISGFTASGATTAGFAGIYIGSGPTGCNVHDNILTGNDLGASIDAGADNTLTGNTINSNLASGIKLTSAMTNLTVQANTITNNPIGIDTAISETATWSVNYNYIVGNTSYGVSSTNALDARYNYWGAGLDGPTHASNANGTGDDVTTNVIFAPWIYLTAPANNGDTVANILAHEVPAYANAIDLGAGWNTFSVPIGLDGQYNTWGELYTLTGLNYVTAYRFDPITQTFVSLATDSTYALAPGEGLYIKMNIADSIPYCYSTVLTIPSRNLSAGWNLIGGGMTPQDEIVTCVSIATIGSTAGYTQIISPAGNETLWLWTTGLSTQGDFVLGEGYWVFLPIDRTLGLFDLTPVTWVP